MVAVFMTLIMTRRLTAMTALILVPTVFALLLGFAGGLGEMVVDGVTNLAPTGVTLIFAILFFGIMIDIGLFVPLVRWVLAAARGDPVRVMVGTAVLALLVSLDGDGATTYMITLSAMLPLYRALNLDKRKLACIVVLANGAMNVVPWAGPTVRVASVLNADPRDVFLPLLIPTAAVALWVIFVAWYLGRADRVRPLSASDVRLIDDTSSDTQAIELAPRTPIAPIRLFANLALMIAVIIALVTALLPTLAIFILGTALALLLNFPNVETQRTALASHGNNALSVGGLIFAAGVFTGIMSGTHMIDAMAASVTRSIPEGLGSSLTLVTAVLSVPFTFFISNDAFYFGILPVLAKSAALYGIDPMAVGRASLIGQSVHLLSPLVASTYLLVGLAEVDFAAFQRFTLRWALGSATVFLIAAWATGAI
ncbi:CitMHS family transporter [Parablastomonas sp. CN1-191]|uniref:CitMHS family transporter n=1 Tax=Parablastomonas sp. CN1-191 TaxID=3400908 RepID=UPI003BF858AB